MLTTRAVHDVIRRTVGAGREDAMATLCAWSRVAPSCNGEAEAVRVAQRWLAEHAPEAR